MKTFTLRLITCGCLALFLLVHGTAQPISTGVSLQLATQRKASITAITYRLAFDLPVNKALPVTGEEILSCRISDITRPLQIDFLAEQRQLQSVTVNGKSVPPLLQQEHIVIDKRFLVKGLNQVAIRFIAGNTSLNRNNDYLYTLLVPERARTVFPCFDQPDLKARFILTLTAPRQWQVLANAAVMDSAVEADRSTYHFAPTDLLPTYLFSFTAGRFTVVTQRGMRFLFRETDSTKIRLSTDSIFQAHTNAIEFLQRFTAIPYPFQKIGFVAIPSFQFGGMEHPGAVQYNAPAFFLDAGATKDQLMARTALISHETAHMWFGDMVTMRWFNDVWMKEVFANFMADKITRQWLGNSTFQLKFLLDHTPAAYNVDRTPGANAIRQPLENLQNAGSMYGNIIYHKAPIMMRQLELLMGAAAFRSGLQEYLQRYAHANANWNELITVLQQHTRANLQEWNKVWVNRPGRPVITYKYANGRLMLHQQAEQGIAAVWPQAFSIALLYADSTRVMNIHLTSDSLSIPLPHAPEAMLFNADGMGYGLFPALLSERLYHLPDAVQRAAGYISAYENMLANRGVKPMVLLQFLLNGAEQEQDELLLRSISNYLSAVYWNALTADERKEVADSVENRLWLAMQKQPSANMKKLLFKTYQDIYQSSTAAKRMFTFWQMQTAPENIKLTEDDYTSLALTIALKTDTVNAVLDTQLVRVTNPDRKARLQFLLPALSPNAAERLAFFNALTDSSNRRKEAWVATGLSFIHHPLRQRAAAQTLPTALNMLEEIQRTGDIFFPQNWLTAIFSNYQSAEAWQVVETFLASHPDYNPFLKAKILQATDNLHRAVQRHP
ncbi:MAG TPA: M1 family aminopeptidase [Chitinophagaceae bacterium]|nr:M1 family aminopeptidase [Chitinophagaceae bacterium]